MENKIKFKNKLKPLKAAKRLSILALILLALTYNSLQAQQISMYSQYQFNMLNVNPAYAGKRAVNSVTLLHRQQWVGMAGGPVTFTLTWDKRAGSSNVGYGAQIYNDHIGIEYTSGFQGFYSYHIPMNKSSLSLGLSGGILYYHANLSDVFIIDDDDPAFSQNVKAWLPTFGIGALYSANRWYAGFSIPSLLKTKPDFDQYDETSRIPGANNHYFLTGGSVININEILKLRPSVLLKTVMGAPVSVDLNLSSWFYEKYGFGISYRVNCDLVFMGEVQITPKLRFGYSYDYSLNELGKYHDGTHEIMLRYEFDSGKMLDFLSPRYY